MTDKAVRPLSIQLWLICWAITAAAFVARAIYGRAITPLILDTDDAMRLTGVHDLLNGQGWWDVVQHRLNTPYGAEIHWSRLIDAPEAALILLLRPFGAQFADVAAAYVWPLALLAVLLWLCARVALRLGGKKAVFPALLLPAFCLITMAEYAPGRLDHHGAQIVLSFVMLGACIAALERPRFAIGAGVAAAAALAIGIEGLPTIAAATMAIGLSWAVSQRHAAAMRDFGLSLALASALALALGVPPDKWFTTAFDQISIVYVTAAVLCGLAFAILSAMPLRAWSARLIAGAAAGVVIGGIVLALWPGLLNGPYGSLDPWLITNWIDRIAEAQPWGVSLVGDPTYPLAVMVPVLVALAVAGWSIARRDAARRGEWLIYGLFLAVALIVMLLQIRAARVATPLAIPAGAALIGWARLRYLARRSIASTLGLIAGWFASAGLVVAVLVNIGLLAFPDYAEATEDTMRESRQACLMPSAFTALAAMPPSRIMTPIDLGAHMLLWTPHSVVAAPYHRNAQGVRDAFDFFNQPLEAERSILEARGIRLVVICPALPEILGMVEHTPDSFVTLFAEGRLPDWLTEMNLGDSPLRAWSVAAR
ncbi:MAG TPA: hypothetical protein VG757_13905 [Devosia sp.]|nr:hypothetical protein [Devosia sp.]